MENEMDMEEADPIKMFIGQISKNMDEEELKQMLEEYGQVQSVNILRDRSSGQSKGCAFATFCKQSEAKAAQEALNNKKVMSGLKNPIQMKPADGQGFTLEERKVFVGMLSKDLVESDVTIMFSPFGAIEICTVVRDQDGNSKGCAFITFGSRNSAINAIKSMHHSQTMPGCRSPLVVKFADTQKEKDAKRMMKQQIPGGVGGGGMMMGGGADPGSMAQMAQYMTMMQQQQFNNPMMTAFMALMGAAGGMNPAQMQQLFMTAAAAAPMMQSNPALAGMLAAFMSCSGNSGENNPIMSAFNSGLMQQFQQAFQSQQMPTDGPQQQSQDSNGQPVMSGFVSGGSLVGGQNRPAQSGGGAASYDAYGNRLESNSSSGSTIVSTAWVPNNASNNSSAGTTDMMNKAYSGFQQYLGSTGASNSAASGVAGSQQEGPDGANLFIYHLPPEFGDFDLVRIFSPFGKVISAKVFIDKQTCVSKCFGFVSYDNAQSAQQAIQSMNGTSCGSRRLKVALKSNKEKNKPY